MPRKPDVYSYEARPSGQRIESANVVWIRRLAQEQADATGRAVIVWIQRDEVRAASGELEAHASSEPIEMILPTRKETEQ